MPVNCFNSPGSFTSLEWNTALIVLIRSGEMCSAKSFAFGEESLVSSAMKWDLESIKQISIKLGN